MPSVLASTHVSHVPPKRKRTHPSKTPPPPVFSTVHTALGPSPTRPTEPAEAAGPPEAARHRRALHARGAAGARRAGRARLRAGVHAPCARATARERSLDGAWVRDEGGGHGVLDGFGVRCWQVLTGFHTKARRYLACPEMAVEPKCQTLQLKVQRRPQRSTPFLPPFIHPLSTLIHPLGLLAHHEFKRLNPEPIY